MAMNAIDVAIEITIGKEGKYSNNPADSGGETMWGITAKVARANGYTGAMKDLPRQLAVDIYRSEYFLKPGFAKVFDISAKIGAELFDSGVNLGPALPARWLQKCLRLLNQQSKLYPDIEVDGKIGNNTLNALTAYLRHRKQDGEVVLLRMLNSLQCVKYIELAEAREKDETFIFGWVLHRVVI